MPLTASLVRAVLRAVNAGGSALTRAGRWPFVLDEAPLLEAARRQTGLHDFGGDEYREPLRVLRESLVAEGRLTPIGRLVARRDLLSLLVARLTLVEDRRRHPGIAEQAIRRPLFIVGLPRTGSTLLHNLLAQDPRHRVAETWEVMAPSPPPEAAGYDRDPRIAEATRRLRWLEALAPDFKKVHPVGARLAIECIAIMSPSFLSPRFHTLYHVPTYQEWLERQDLRPAYEFHRRFLQHLGWRTPADRWVLKAPAHLFGFDALFAAYPDAVLVQTHRDPLTVLASVASLTAVLQGAVTAELDLAEIGAEVARRWANGLERAMQVRRGASGPDARFLDVHYHELARDPLGTIRQIYRHLGATLAPEAEQRMRRHLARSPKDQYGAHRYSLDAFGLDPTELSHRFKAYREFFGVR
jgi:hypothetical protein